MDHPVADDQLVGKIEVCFHQEDCPEFVDLDHARLLFDHDGQARLPAEEGVTTVESDVTNQGVYFG